jgi:serine/threonine protein kinase
LKLANVLLHIRGKDKEVRDEKYLRDLNLDETPFEVKIADLGFAKIVE